MPFQAIPIALRKTTGTPLSKLVLIMLTRACRLRESDPWARVYFEPEDLAKLCQCTFEEVRSALLHLAMIGEIRFPVLDRDVPDFMFIEVKLPISVLERGARRRIKCGPDQIEALFERDGLSDRGCALCGEPGDEDDLDWEVDHIIPQSVGGADVEENCQVACPKCNSRKRARLGWVDFLGGRK